MCVSVLSSTSVSYMSMKLDLLDSSEPCIHESKYSLILIYLIASKNKTDSSVGIFLLKIAAFFFPPSQIRVYKVYVKETREPCFRKIFYLGSDIFLAFLGDYM